MARLLALTLVLLLVVSIACARTASDAQPIENVYSKSCGPGQFAIYPGTAGEGSFVCEEAWDCRTDDDCSRLLIERLPPRVGVCVNGTCSAVCGSGILRPCR